MGDHGRHARTLQKYHGTNKDTTGPGKTVHTVIHYKIKTSNDNGIRRHKSHRSTSGLHFPTRKTSPNKVPSPKSPPPPEPPPKPPRRPRPGTPHNTLLFQEVSHDLENQGKISPKVQELRTASKNISETPRNQQGRRRVMVKWSTQSKTTRSRPAMTAK